MDDTEYLLGSPVNAERLQESVKELEEGLKGKYGKQAEQRPHPIVFAAREQHA